MPGPAVPGGGSVTCSHSARSKAGTSAAFHSCGLTLKNWQKHVDGSPRVPNTRRTSSQGASVTGTTRTSPAESPDPATASAELLLDIEPGHPSQVEAAVSVLVDDRRKHGVARAAPDHDARRVEVDAGV